MKSIHLRINSGGLYQPHQVPADVTITDCPEGVDVATVTWRANNTVILHPVNSCAEVPYSKLMAANGILHAEGYLK